MPGANEGPSEIPLELAETLARSGFRLQFLPALGASVLADIARRMRTRLGVPSRSSFRDSPASAAARLRRGILRVACRAEARSGICPPPPLRGYGAASFAWLAEPKLTLRPSCAFFVWLAEPKLTLRPSCAFFVWLAEPKLTLQLLLRVSEGWWPRFVPDGTH